MKKLTKLGPRDYWVNFLRIFKFRGKFKKIEKIQKYFYPEFTKKNIYLQFGRKVRDFLGMLGVVDYRGFWK